MAILQMVETVMKKLEEFATAVIKLEERISKLEKADKDKKWYSKL